MEVERGTNIALDLHILGIANLLPGFNYKIKHCVDIVATSHVGKADTKTAKGLTRKRQPSLQFCIFLRSAAALGTGSQMAHRRNTFAKTIKIVSFFALYRPPAY